MRVSVVLRENGRPSVENLKGGNWPGVLSHIAEVEGRQASQKLSASAVRKSFDAIIGMKSQVPEETTCSSANALTGGEIILLAAQ